MLAPTQTAGVRMSTIVNFAPRLSSIPKRFRVLLTGTTLRRVIAPSTNGREPGALETGAMPHDFPHAQVFHALTVAGEVLLLSEIASFEAVRVKPFR